ncbi:MAG: hypothetical protein M1837_005047 [Sclerophora amabilis]|nr:MAG: hypothetical protein M1837_005047 [Sclerophora amabilis]
MSRPPVGAGNLRNGYEILKTIDDGSAGGNNPGGMNGGIFVVRRKVDSLRLIEKRLTPQAVKDDLVTQEIYLLRSLSHPNICEYYDAFIVRDLPSSTFAASLYMEYCNLGTAHDLIRTYNHRPDRPYITEAFLWHTFHSLLKALVYLHNGAAGELLAPRPGWRSVLHKDIKPSNVFVKTSRRGGRYPTIVLGDFGVAIRDDDPGWRRQDVEICGTLQFQPPEVPMHDLAGKGDVWGVGAVLHAMCRLDHGPVPNPPPGQHPQTWFLTPEVRVPKRAGSHYSPQLNEILSAALTLDRARRPTAMPLLVEVRGKYAASAVKYKPLPSWLYGNQGAPHAPQG